MKALKTQKESNLIIDARDREFMLIELERFLFEAQMRVTQYLNRTGPDPMIESLARHVVETFREVKEVTNQVIRENRLK